jgi:hypothetical protein
MMAAYLSKKTMAPIIGEGSTLHILFGRFTLFQRDDYSNLRVFGCTCFVQPRKRMQQVTAELPRNGFRGSSAVACSPKGKFLISSINWISCLRFAAEDVYIPSSSNILDNMSLRIEMRLKEEVKLSIAHRTSVMEGAGRGPWGCCPGLAFCTDEDASPCGE